MFNFREGADRQLGFAGDSAGDRLASVDRLPGNAEGLSQFPLAEVKGEPRGFVFVGGHRLPDQGFDGCEAASDLLYDQGQAVFLDDFLGGLDFVFVDHQAAAVFAPAGADGEGFDAVVVEDVVYFGEGEVGHLCVHGFVLFVVGLLDGFVGADGFGRGGCEGGWRGLVLGFVADLEKCFACCYCSGGWHLEKHLANFAGCVEWCVCLFHYLNCNLKLQVRKRFLSNMEFFI